MAFAQNWDNAKRSFITDDLDATVDAANKDKYAPVINDLKSLEKFLNDNNCSYDVVDYDMYPLDTRKIKFIIDGDWKHDHLRFKDLIQMWARKNHRNIFKIETEFIDNSDSDDYSATYAVYIAKDKDSYNNLNSLRGLFTESKKILYVIKDNHGNQLSSPSEDDSELWDRVEVMEARGRKGLKVVVYTGVEESFNKKIEEELDTGVREYSDRLYDMLQDGVLDALNTACDLIYWCSEDDIQEYMRVNDLLYDEEELDESKSCKADFIGNKGDNREKKNSKAVKEELEDEDGWGDSINDILYDVFSDIDQLEYEVRNCVRGGVTRCKNADELAKYIEELSDRLDDAAQDIRYNSSEINEKKK